MARINQTYISQAVTPLMPLLKQAIQRLGRLFFKEQPPVYDPYEAARLNIAVEEQSRQHTRWL